MFFVYNFGNFGIVGKISKIVLHRSIMAIWEMLILLVILVWLVKLVITRVNNKERKRVSNALYTPCNMFSASNVTCSRAHVTSPRAKQLIFLRTEKNRGVFHEFYARFFTNARFILWSARAFGRNRLALACTRGHAHNVPFESSALIGQFLNSWRVTFRKHLIRSI